MWTAPSRRYGRPSPHRSSKTLGRRGLVVGLSGGSTAPSSRRSPSPRWVPSACSACSCPSARRRRTRAPRAAAPRGHLGVRTSLEDIAPTLEGDRLLRAPGYEAIRAVFPTTATGWKVQDLAASAARRRALQRLAPHSAVALRGGALVAYATGRLSPCSWPRRTSSSASAWRSNTTTPTGSGTPSRGRRTGSKYDQGFFVKQGDSAATSSRSRTSTRRRCTRSRRELGVPEEIQRAPRRPTRTRWSRRRRSSISRSPTTGWTSASPGVIEASSAEELAPAVGLTRCRSSTSIATSTPSAAPRATCTPRRRSARTRSLTLEALAEVHVRHRRHRPDRGALGLRRRVDALARMASALLVTAAPTSSGSTATPARASRTRASRSSTSPRGSSRSRTRTARCGSSSTARSSTTSSCARSSSAEGHVPHARATPRSSSTRTSVGRARRSPASTGSSPSRSGTRDARRSCSRATGSACGRSTCAEHGGPRLLRERGEGDLRGDPDVPARLRSGRASTRPSRSGRSWRRARSSRASRSSARARAHVRARRPAERAYARLTFPEDGEASSRDRSTTPSSAVREALARRRACAWCAPTSPSGATSPAGSTARSWRRSGSRRRGRSSPRSRCASRTRSTTRRRSSARWSRASAPITTRSWCGRATSPRCSPM
jgi:hypothetical protein